MAKQEKATWPRDTRNAEAVETDSKDAVPASPVEETPASPADLTPAQKFAAAAKAAIKGLSEQENAAYEAQKKAKEQAEGIGNTEPEAEYIDDTDYSTHNALATSLKEKLAAAKAEANKSTQDA